MILLTIIALALVLALGLEKRLNAEREKEWSLERAALLQRIQAPEVAVADFVVAGDEEPSYEHFDEDEEPT